MWLLVGGGGVSALLGGTNSWHRDNLPSALHHSLGVLAGIGGLLFFAGLIIVLTTKPDE